MKIEFCCPNCAFNKVISENEIPQTATQCKCPNCKELLSLSEAFTKPKSAVSITIDQTVDDWFENNQLGSSKKREKESESSSKYLELVDKGLSLLYKENILEAMLLLEEAERLNSTPKVRSHLAYCRAKESQDYNNAIKMCLGALKEEPTVADHYLNLGRIYLMINKKGPALQAFKKGIKLGPHPKLMQELRKFEKRKPPVISSLPREHILNRKLGKLLSCLGLR